jgi:nucleotide-binding universal stress UspA family protein
MRHPIVCGIDGSKESREAARVAADLARALGRGLVLAHAADDPPTFPYGDARLRELQRREATDAGRRLLEDVAADLPAIDIETQILFGDPFEALPSVCHDRDAALLVVGARGRSGLAAAWHGTISARLAGATGCPVVVVAPDAAEHFLVGQHSGDGARELQPVTALPGRIAA